MLRSDSLFLPWIMGLIFAEKFQIICDNSTSRTHHCRHVALVACTKSGLNFSEYWTFFFKVMPRTQY